MSPTPTADTPNLGDLISTIYAEFMAIYGDAELAAVATAAVLNDLLSAGARGGDEVADA